MGQIVTSVPIPRPEMERPTWNMLFPISTLCNFLSLRINLNLRQRRRSTLQYTTQDREETAKLDISLPSELLSRPHHEQRSDCAASREQAIGRRDDVCGFSGVAWCALEWEGEVGVPSWLADCGADYAGAVSVCLSEC
jgi:hypothetical protein